MTETPDWPPLGDVTAAQLREVRLQVHHAVQALAAFGQAFAPEQPDDSHRSIDWDVEGQCFWSQASEDGTRVALNFQPLELKLFPAGDPGPSLRLMGTTLKTLRAWLDRSVSEVDGRGEEHIDWPEYDMPEHRVTQGIPFEPLPRGQKSLAAWFTRATAAIGDAVSGDETASVLRTWPHHFDIASLKTLEQDDSGAPLRTVGVGLSPGDHTFDEPYFYVLPWPAPEPEGLPEFEGPGRWHTDGWVGLVLTATDVAEVGAEPDQHAATRAFFTGGIVAAETVLDCSAESESTEPEPDDEEAAEAQMESDDQGEPELDDSDLNEPKTD